MPSTVAAAAAAAPTVQTEQKRETERERERCSGTHTKLEANRRQRLSGNRYTEGIWRAGQLTNEVCSELIKHAERKEEVLRQSNWNKGQRGDKKLVIVS